MSRLSVNSIVHGTNPALPVDFQVAPTVLGVPVGGGGGGSYTPPTVTSETTVSVTTTATINDAAFAIFADTPCTELVILNDSGADVEYQRNATGVTIVIQPGQTRRVVGITNANQIGIRRVDYASGISRTSTITARALTNTETFVLAGTLNVVISSGGGNTQLPSLACSALEIMNTSGKIIMWRIGSTAAYSRIKEGESVVIRGIANANQVFIKPYDSVANFVRPISVEAFVSGLSVPLNSSRQVTQINSGARIVLDDFNNPSNVGPSNLFLSVAEQADQKTTLVPKNAIPLAFFPTVATSVLSQSAACTDSTAGEKLFGTTAVEYTQPGASTIATFAPATILPSGISVIGNDIHIEYAFPDNLGVNYTGANLGTFSVELYSAGTPASPGSNFHTVTISAFAQGFVRIDARTGGTIISYSMPIESFTASGAGADLAAVTWARFRLQGGSGATGAKFRPYSIKAVKKAKSKATIVFVFDDLHIGQYTNALPVLSKYNYPACCAIDTVVKMGQTGFISPSQLVTLHQKHGWQMIGQVQGGQGAGVTVDTAISAEHAVTQGARFKAAMKALGISGTEDFSRGSSSFHNAPGITGLYYDNWPVLKRMFRTSCEFLGGNNSNPPLPFGESAPFGDPYAIRRVNMGGFTAGTLFERWQNLVDQAIANKGVVVFGAHSEFNTAGEALTALGSLVEYIRTQELLGNVEVLTMNKLVETVYDIFGAATADGTLKVIAVPTTLTVTSANAGNILDLAENANVTVPVGLPSGFNFTGLLPATGTVTITPGAGVLINGVSTPIVRSATNFTLALIPTATPNSYKLTGV